MNGASTTQRKVPRLLCGALFVVGMPWLFFAFMMLTGPFLVFVGLLELFSDSRYFWLDILAVPESNIIAGQSMLGIYIWLHWAGIATGKVTATGRFWMMAALHHAVWLLVLFYYGVITYEWNGFFARSPIGITMGIYSVVFVAICLVAVRCSPRHLSSDGLTGTRPVAYSGLSTDVGAN